MSNTESSNRRRFAIALPFPGERRAYVERGKTRIFYDAWHALEMPCPFIGKCDEVAP